MIYPAIEDLTMGKYNRYTLVVATAKCARIVTDEYVQQREHAEKLIANKETDKSLASMIKKEYRDEKAVKNAINRIYAGEFKIVEPTDEPEEPSIAEMIRTNNLPNDTVIIGEIDADDAALDPDEEEEEEIIVNDSTDEDPLPVNTAEVGIITEETDYDNVN
nr:hypothetical protein [Clostridia bacterium]